MRFAASMLIGAYAGVCLALIIRAATHAYHAGHWLVFAMAVGSLVLIPLIALALRRPW